VNSAALNDLAETILGAQKKDRTPMGIAFAISSAGQHLTPELTAEVKALRARVAELEAAAFGDAPVRLLEPIAQIGHLHDCVAAQKHRADTLNWISKEQRQRANAAEARVAELEATVTALEVPRPGNAFPLVLQRSYGHADRWAICDRQGRRWTRGAGWCPESGGIADDRLRNAARFTLAEALPLARRLAAEDPHDSPLHTDYRLGHDLPEMPHA
jgi:hypothetical protein